MDPPIRLSTTMTILKMELVCRTCLNESNNLNPIFMNNEEDIFKMLQSCTGLNILAMDGFSNHICSICLNKVRISYEFRQQCEISHNTFINFMKDHPRETSESKLANSNLFLIINGGNACEVLMNLVCRTCLNETNNMKPIFMDDGNDISKMLQSCSGLKIHAKDGSPTNICSDCLNKLHISYDFRRQCETFINFMGAKINDNNDFQIPKLTNSIEIYKCSMCANQYTRLVYLQEHFKMAHPPIACEIKLENDVLPTFNHNEDEIGSSNATDLVMDCVEEKYTIAECELTSDLKENQHRDSNVDIKNHESDKVSNNKSCNIIGSEISTNDQINDENNDQISNYKLDNICKRDNLPKLENRLNDENSHTIRQKKRMQQENRDNKRPQMPSISEPEICEICQKCFSTPRNLQLHMKLGHWTVDMVKPLIHLKSADDAKRQDDISTCTICNLTFEIKSNYYQHMQSEHKGVKLHGCDQCNAKFSMIKQLRRHKVTHLNLKSFSCDQCDMRFSQDYNRRRHMRIHLNIKPHKCDQCDATFTRADKLRMHLMNQHYNKQAKLHQCTQCNEKFYHFKQLQRHHATHLDEKSLHCEQCNMRFSQPYNKVRHMRTHSNVNPYKCDKCDMSFKRKDSLQAHQVNRHNQQRPLKPAQPKTEKCEICQKAFSTPANLKIHMKLGHFAIKSGPFLCSVCGKQFARHSKLVYHMRLHNGDTPYKCKFCGKGFPRSGELTKHVRYHTKDKRYLCTICQNRFYCGTHLRNHIKRVHIKERPFKCPHCDKSFFQEYELKSHVSRHTGKLMQCDICGNFIEDVLLTKHKHTQHGVINKSDFIEKFSTWFVSLTTNLIKNPLKKKHQCTVCGKNFPRAYSLNRHKKSHTGERPFKCTHCDKSFPERYDLTKHNRVHLKLLT